MNVRKTIFGLYILLFIAIIVTSGVFFWQTRAEYRRLREVEMQSQKRLAELEARLQEQKKILDRLRNDPAFLEKVIRKQLKYAKPDEYIFRFEN